MDGQMMDFQLTLPHILKRAETYFARGEIVTRLPDKSFHRTTHGETLRRAKQLAVALQQLGLERGDRVATLCWNHYQHHEAYFGIPCGGFVLHTLNLRLHPNDLAYIASHAGDKVVIVDRSLLPLLEQFRERTQIEHVFVVEDSYEDLLASASADDWVEPDLDENEAAAMCYTSGTTGLPKGVVYSHRSSVLHALGVAANHPLGLGTCVHDTILPVVPMFHANAWGYPYVATMLGAKLVYPGPAPRRAEPARGLRPGEGHLVGRRADDLARDAAGARREPRRVGSLAHEGNVRRRLRGPALADRRVPAARHDDRAGLGHDRDLAGRDDGRPPARPRRARRGVAVRPARDGRPAARARRVARACRRGGDPVGRRGDGRARGARPVGRVVVLRHARAGGPLDVRRLVPTGDIVSINPRGYIQIKDRSKDVIKSGGEWISSVELENALMAHPSVAEAAVIAVPDVKWAERPLAAIVLKQGAAASADELRDFLAPNFAKWWLPERFEFVEEIPKTSVGKFKKMALRDQFAAKL